MSVAETDKILTQLYLSVKVLQDLESVAHKSTYGEIFRSTIDTVQSLQKDLLERLNLSEQIELIQMQLKKQDMPMESDPIVCGKQLETTGTTQIYVSLHRKLKGAQRAPGAKIQRMLRSCMIQIQSLIDRLSLPFTVSNMQVHMKNDMTVGVYITLMTVGD
jgi:hypothetical protein